MALADLLDRLGEEAGSLALATARAETALQSVLEGLRGLPPGVGGDLQQIDLVRQSLEDLSRLMWIAAAAVPPGRAVSRDGIGAAVVLADLHRRLTGRHAGEAGVPSGTDEADDLVLF
jgi:hypothetical protein